MDDYHRVPPTGGWNIFARVLQDLLAVRGYGLGHLDDRAFVHPEKVRRLKRSLITPKSLPLLTIDEMDEVMRVFQLNPREKIQLRAALLTTAIEATLMDRIEAAEALRAAEQILPIIEQALRSHADTRGGLALAREGGRMSAEETEIDSQLEGALNAIDRSTLALHLSRHVQTQAERREHLRQAREYFGSALAQLEAAEAALQASAAWRMWHDEATRGLASANQRLVLMGG